MNQEAHAQGTFEEELNDWFRRSPFFAIALFVHLLAFFAINAIPWNQLRDPEPTFVIAVAPTPPPDSILEPEPAEPIEPELIEPAPVETPVVAETVQTEQDSLVDAEADIDFLSESPFQNDNPATPLGIGGGGPLEHSDKLGRRRAQAANLSRPLDQAIHAGLDWLAEHQSDNGSWEARDFAINCGRGQELSNGEGDALHDTGVTALAALAFLGIGETMEEGPYRQNLRGAITWLREQQDRQSGLIGPSTSKEFLYDHAIATLAFAEAYAGSKSPILRDSLSKAVEFCIAAQNPYSGWRYGAPPNGENDTSVTGWMVLALAAAREAGIQTGDTCFEGALAFLDEVTDPDTGQAGYTARGTSSSRLPRLVSVYPIDQTEALTGVAVMSRAFVAGLRETDPLQDELVKLGAERLLEHLPEWDANGGGGGDSDWSEGDAGSTNDMYAWYAGSYGLYQVGGQAWSVWRRAMEQAVLPNQRTAPPCLAGSWDPGGPWGSVGGRVYSTALMVLCLETQVRYERR